jgi:hypothetical protein
MELREFNKELSIELEICGESSPLIKITKEGDISFYRSIKEKTEVLENRNETDRFIISRCGKWTTDVFKVSEKDIKEYLSD